MPRSSANNRGTRLKARIHALAVLCAALYCSTGTAQVGAVAGPGANRVPLESGNCARQQWPREALRYEIEGKVRIAYRVTPEGDVNDARVTKSSGWALLDDASVAAARTCRFPPDKAAALQDREMPVEFVWTLEGERVHPGLVAGSCVPAGPIDGFQPYDNRATSATGIRVRFLVDGKGQPYDIKLEGDPGAALAEQAVRLLETCRFAFDDDVWGMRTNTVTGRVLLR